MYFYALLTIIFLLIVYELLHERKMKAYSKQLPGPFALPFIGSAWKFLGSSSDFFRSLDEILQGCKGNCCALIGPQLYFLLSDPRHLQVLTSNPNLTNKSDEYKYLKPWLGDGLIAISGEKWKRNRKFLTPTFHLNILKNFIPVMEENVDKLLEKLSDFEGGESFNIAPFVALCTLDIISEATMGVSVNAQSNGESKYVQAIRGMCNIVILRVRHFLLRLDIFFNISPSKLRQTQYLKTIFEFIEDVIRRRKIAIAQKIESHDEDTETGVKKRVAFLDHLLMSDIDGTKLSDRSLRDEVNTFMFAGHDTTATAIAFTLYCIAENSDAQEKVFAEQQSIFGDDKDRLVEYNDLQEMKYLDLVIKEGLRMFPPAPFIARLAEENTEINELNIPEGSTVAVSVYHMHRRSDLYEDPHVFKPERFAIDSQENISRDPFSYAPFSVGLRNCIGQKFSIMEMKVAISKLVRKFQLHSGGKEPILAFDAVLKSHNGLHVRVTKRQS